MAAAEREVKHLCITCGKHFTKSCNLARHMRIHNEDKQMCAHCGKGFRTSDYLRLHIRKEHSGEEKPIQCLICGLIFTVRLDLKRHMRQAHKGQKPPRLPHVCSECGKGFGRLQLLQDHIVTHTGAKPYNCSECGQGFLHQYKYEKHVEIHRAKKQNICRDCGQGFSSHIRLTEHMQTHLTHECPDCGKEFKTEASLMMHYNLHTNPFECSACGKGFSDEAMLRKHMAIHTTCPEAPAVCPECGRWFSDPAHLKDHMWSHKPDAQFLCYECFRSFGTHTALKIHMRSHSGVKTHVCSGCGKGFNTAAHLDNHQSNCDKVAADSNEGASDTVDVSPETKEAACDDTEPNVSSSNNDPGSDQSHICPTCGETFKLRGQLEAHQKTHTGEKPYICDECGNGFTEAGSLRRHQLIHQGEKPFSCIHCFITFRTSTQLKAHIERRHAEPQGTQYACPECMKALPSPEALKVHMIIHEEASHVCSVCSKAFQTSDLLNIHLQIHRSAPTDAEHIETPQPIDANARTKIDMTKQILNPQTGNHVCPTCGKEFEKQKHLTQHIKRHSAIRQFWCRRCGKGFAEAAVLKRHMLTHGGKKPIQCMECGKRFMDVSHLRAHMKSNTHRHRKHIPCPTCGKGVSSREALERHMEIHTRNAMGETSSKKTTHPETEDKNCEEADGNSNLSDHHTSDVADEDNVNTNTETGSRAGDEEDKVSSNHSDAENLDAVDDNEDDDDDDENNMEPQSAQTSHTDLQTQAESVDESRLDEVTSANRISHISHVCNTCGERCQSIAKLRAHMKKERCYVCADCGRGFGVAVVLRRHLLTHSGKKPKQCKVCGKRFMDATHLNKHMRTHNRNNYYPWAGGDNAEKSLENTIPQAEQQEVQVKDEPMDAEEFDEEYKRKRAKKCKRRHVCFTCGKDFQSRWNLTAHMRRHTKEKPYACSECGKAFAEAIVLKRHRLTHGGEKPKQCSECGKRFMDETHLRAHMWTHSNEKQFSCPVCHKGLASKYSLAFHMKKLHTRETPHVCSECGKEFATSDELNDHVENHRLSVEMHIQRIENEIYYVSAQPKTENVSPTGTLRRQTTRSQTADTQRETDQLKSHAIKPECVDETENAVSDLNPDVVDLFENLNHTARLRHLDSTEADTYPNHLSPQILNVLDNHRRAHAAETDSIDSNDVEAFSNYSENSGTIDASNDHLRTEAKGNLSLDQSNIVMPDEPVKTALVESESEAPGKRSTRNQLRSRVSQVAEGAEQKPAVKDKDGNIVCPVCSKVFKRTYSLKAHMVTHTKARPWVCEECGDGFTEAGSLRRHIRIHTGEKPFLCTQCHKAFRTSTHLKKHTLTHKGYVYNLKKSRTKKREPRLNTEHPTSNTNFQDVGNDSSTGTAKHGNVPADPTEAETTQRLLSPHILNLLGDQWKPHATEGGRVSSDEDEVASHHSESSISIDLDDDHPINTSRDLDLDDLGNELNQSSPVKTSLLELEKENSDMVEKSFAALQAVDNNQKKQPTEVGNTSADKPKRTWNPSRTQVSKVKARDKQKPSMGLLKVAGGKAVCPVCAKVFKKMSNLKAHFVTHTKARPWVCEECGDGFTEAGSLRRHMRIHTGEKPFVCTQCFKPFRTSTHLKAHTRTHTGIKEFQCLECQKSFSTSSSLRLHMMLHTGEKPFVCLVCNKGFRMANLLDYHMVKHSAAKVGQKLGPANKANPTTVTPKQHMCSECGKCFGTNGILTKHKMTHTGEKPYLCSECGKKFVDATKLREHMGTHNKEKFYACSECGKGFSAAHSLKSHLKKKHPGEGPSVCGSCGQGFRSPDLLNEHLTTCDKAKKVSESAIPEALEKEPPNERPHVCFECGKGFGTKSILKKHLITHTDEKPHECCYCGRKFRTYTHLKRHIMTHTGEKPYGCTECGKRFAGSLALDLHFRLHTGEKPYACVWCGGAYRTLGLLSTHIRTCTGGKHPGKDNKEVSVSTSAQLVRRRQAVSEEYIYSNCYLCVQGFDRIPDLIQHLAVHALSL